MSNAASIKKAKDDNPLSHIAWRASFPHPRRRMAFIKQIGKRIAQEFQPEKIILFGSQAYGKPKWYSDIDLLVILPFEGSQLKQAVTILNRLDLLVPIDLLAYTPDQISRRLEMGDDFVREILDKGKVIYEAAYA